MEVAAPQVRVTDVTLREFGQNVSRGRLGAFTPETRVRMARDLLQAGLTAIELFSCVHPGVAPAMAPDLLRRVAEGLGRPAGAEIVTLVPNRAGYRTFLDLGLGPEAHGHVLGMFVSAVEVHNLANLGRTVSDTLEGYEGIARDAASRGIRMSGYVSGVFGYRERDGAPLVEAPVEEVNLLVDRFFSMGARTVTLSDLQGVADEAATVRFLERLLELRRGNDLGRLGYHPHHVSGERAVDNSLAALGLGIRRFDASLGGTGGCVTGAPGNQPTELLVQRLHRAGAETGIDENRLLTLARRYRGRFSPT
jgi:hydroxymethylglutaryl-CoA lyase